MSQLSESQSEGFIIAIDGPVASGKGTLAPRLAQKVHGFYLYSGSVFRCLGYLCLQKGLDTNDEIAVSSELQDVQLRLTDGRVFLHDEDVTEQIKSQEVGMAASNVGVFAAARSTMVRIMREIAAEKTKNGTIVVTEGRDMATTVFPHAGVKIFLTASPEVRAKRRLAQAQANGELGLSFKQVLSDTIKRDKQDSERKISPLAREPENVGYTIIDSSGLSEDQTIAHLLGIVKEKGLQYD